LLWLQFFQESRSYGTGQCRESCWSLECNAVPDSSSGVVPLPCDGKTRGWKFIYFFGWFLLVGKCRLFLVGNVEQKPQVLRLCERPIWTFAGQIVENENWFRSGSKYQSALASSNQRDEEVRWLCLQISCTKNPFSDITNLNWNIFPLVSY